MFCQSIQIPSLDNRANLNSLNLHLAATKLCKEFYANNDLNEAREDKSNFMGIDNYGRYGCHICAEAIRYPFMSPLESFVDRYLKDKRLTRNKSNAFTLRALREEIKTNYLDDYNAMVDSVDTENMVFYQYDLIQGYSIDTNEMFISLWNFSFKNLLPNTTPNGRTIHIPLLNGHGVKSDGSVVGNANNQLGYFKVPMTESRAQEIYANYSKHFNPNPPFAIGTKLFYAFRLGKENEGKPRDYQVVLKKVEFFLPSVENLKKIQTRVLKETYLAEHKIAEVIFEEKLYFTEKGYSFQNIESID